MAEIFIKVFKWAISVSFFVVGIYCLRTAAETGEIEPLSIVVLGFGVVYWLSRSTYEASKKIFLTGLGIVIAMWVVTVVAGDFIASLLGYEFGFYMFWWIASLIIGVPVMARAFWNED